MRLSSNDVASFATQEGCDPLAERCNRRVMGELEYLIRIWNHLVSNDGVFFYGIVCPEMVEVIKKGRSGYMHEMGPDDVEQILGHFKRLPSKWLQLAFYYTLKALRGRRILRNDLRSLLLMLPPPHEIRGACDICGLESPHDDSHSECDFESESPAGKGAFDESESSSDDGSDDDS